ncbi:MAG: hypothetical protein ACE366_19925 [Bradymonadia bacterium]
MDFERTSAEPESSDAPPKKIALGVLRLQGRRVKAPAQDAREQGGAHTEQQGPEISKSESARLDQLLEALDSSLSKLESSLFDEENDTEPMAPLPPADAPHPVAFIDPEVLSIIEESPTCALPDFEERVRTMIRFQESGDTAGALDTATEIFVRLDGEGTGYFTERFGRVLGFACRRRLGDLSACPSLTMADNIVLRLPLDRRTGFLLSLVDGQTSFKDLILLSGMHESEALCLLTRLASWSVISTGRQGW